jgi:GNAT superfamily N-acetyltransferase
MWRPATPAEDDAIVAMCVALNREDPCEAPVPEAHTRRTLVRLREEPARGRALVLDLGAAPEGYALLISYWSNELGGEVCTVDEVYVRPECRGQGHASRLLESISTDRRVWPEPPVALQLEVSPKNVRAAALYRRLGLEPIRNATLRRAR